MTTQTALAPTEAVLESPSTSIGLNEWLGRTDVAKTSRAVSFFLDVATTATGRATHYNSKKEQQDLLAEAHRDIFTIDRGLYAVLNCLDGVNDISIQTAVQSLLDNARVVDGHFLLDFEQEGKALAHLVGKLPPTRMLKLYRSFAANKVNNARSRKLILRSILHRPVSKMEHWAVSYRTKMALAITHAIGKKRASILKSILSNNYYNSTGKLRCEREINSSE